MRTVLIANRGEIAIRIARACRAAGVGSVAVYSEADRGAPHTLAADRAVPIGPAPARDSYLNVEALLTAARDAGADAVHPGYGFLAESAAFARAVEGAGLVWIGPPPDAIATMGDKLAARAAVARASVPLVPGVEVVGGDLVEAARRAAALGYPVLVKAAAGGGGKGMRTVATEAELADALAAAGREATAAFGDGRVYLEKLLVRPRHVEVQVLGDRHGTLVHLGERECSIQRRHQKIVEETPCPVLGPALRAEMAAAALAAARAVGYASAGTVEFLLDPEGRFHFLEMNTRVQVEHPITELVSGVDIVAAQLRIAAGEPLGFTQDDVACRGHAIEARLYAEDPAASFFPSAGPILALREPAGPGIRVDSGIAAGAVVPIEYDPLLAKISAWGPDRATAIARLAAALRDTAVLGPITNLAFLLDVLAHPAFVRGDTHTGFLDEHLPAWRPPAGDEPVAALVAALALGRPTAAAGAGDGARAPRRGDARPWRLGAERGRPPALRVADPRSTWRPTPRASPPPSTGSRIASRAFAAGPRAAAAGMPRWKAGARGRCDGPTGRWAPRRGACWSRSRAWRTP
jgi:acetyl-CoA carboxylase biotin carboxylase subunit